MDTIPSVVGVRLLDGAGTEVLRRALQRANARLGTDWTLHQLRPPPPSG